MVLFNIYNHHHTETHFIFSIFVSMTRPRFIYVISMLVPRIRDLIAQIFRIDLHFARQLLRQYYFKKCLNTGFAGTSRPKMTSLGNKPTFFNFIKYGLFGSAMMSWLQTAKKPWVENKVDVIYNVIFKWRRFSLTLNSRTMRWTQISI